MEIPSGSWKKYSPTLLQYNLLTTSGPNFPIDSSSALELFERFFMQEAWDLLVQETNRYANIVTGSTPNARPWNDTNVEEMKAFLGVMIYMGIVKLPCLELYWSRQYNGIETPSIARVMPLVRFEQLFRCFHLSNNSNQIPYGQPGHDKLFKVRSLLDIVVPHFQNEYSLHQECAIDEAMIPFKGRLALKQYMKDKPTKWGIKVFVLADSHNGYIKNIQIYTGKSEDNPNVDIGLCSKVCLDLLEGLDTYGLTLYTDNYYTSLLFSCIYIKIWV